MISTAIICKNEEKNIRNCIESTKWTDEIIVVDGLSTDKTKEIAEGLGAKVFLNEFRSFKEQREFALSKCSGDWILVLDADEICSTGLKNEIQDVLTTVIPEICGFRIPRKNYFLGKWIRHCGWYPSYQMRFFRKDAVKVKNRLVHEGYEIDGKTYTLICAILHNTVQSISEYTERINHYSTLQAIEKREKGAGFWKILLKPSFSCIHKYIFQGGFLDGVEGLMVTYFHIMTNMLTLMKIREMNKKKKG
jgi:glycosyltransferase involved in cell wall biosynthesis